MIRCIAVDDETPALDILEDNISRIPFLQLVKKCKNAYQARDVLREENIDLVFLDIEMPGISGLRLLKELEDKPMVIFMTAYRKYAADGYDLDVLDYLVKPVSFQRFLKAAHKALEYQELRKKDYIFIQSAYKLTKLFIHDILYIEGLGNYIKIHLASSPRAILSKQSMKTIGGRLPAGKHIRVHKSFIVMVDKICSIHNESITIGKTEIPLSRFYRDEFFRVVHNA
ncbi:LytTR family DNA-binding domain-containing protein [Flavitalea sp. BT771]|uniref:LytR/AlgR family response regulator transcription factor n=1 Tax=Flavitalea sp. BT771 TaxID=3063329 RepID=UPI0026E2B85E|nr:LytTR family DNA-binding domain-containing protein [Flavitalea sp. BT771]MDO6430476.1 LytTR family DNA-binding domain-containing protein [Flavitalea sp. BT771]MDV6219384.1 LytTR family DNA-binding domain-containing protein [Flavitalea sp. BT771]